VNLLKKVYGFLRSVKLALVLIAYIVITVAVATIVPQGREISFYDKTYPQFLSRFIVTIGFNTYFKSVLFLVPVSLFFINLSVCTFHRLFTRLKRNVKKRFGPDIIHIGLLLLMIGGLLTLMGRRESVFYLAKGNSVNLPGGYELILKSFKYLTYKDDRPRDWLSSVDIKKGGKTVRSFTIEVNRPLKIGALRIYQYTYSNNSQVLLTDTKGNTGLIHPGYYVRNGDEIIVFKGVDVPADNKLNSQTTSKTEKAVFEKWIGKRRIGVYKIPSGGLIGSFRVTRMQSKMLTGLKAVDDPGVVPVIIAFILIGLGLALTFTQKLGDNKL